MNPCRKETLRESGSVVRADPNRRWGFPSQAVPTVDERLLVAAAPDEVNRLTAVIAHAKVIEDFKPPVRVQFFVE